MFDDLFIYIFVIFIVYTLIVRAIFGINEIIKNLQQQTEEAIKQTEETMKQTEYQKALYDEIRAYFKAIKNKNDI